MTIRFALNPIGSGGSRIGSHNKVKFAQTSWLFRSISHIDGVPISGHCSPIGDSSKTSAEDYDHLDEGYQLQLTPIEWIILIALWAECALWGVVVFLLAIVIAIVNCFKNAKKE